MLTCWPRHETTHRPAGRGRSWPGQAILEFCQLASPGETERGGRREEGGERREGEKDIKKKVRAQGWLILEGADSLSNLSFQWFEMNCSSH